MRLLLIALVCLAAAAEAVEGGAAPLKGRPIADVIDEFRAAGYPFAYSTNLVTNNLRVRDAAAASEPLEIVREILRPHGLTIREEAGVYLVVRYDAASLPKGTILLVITTRGGDQAVPHVAVAVQPELAQSNRITPGVIEYAEVSAGRYRFDIQATGFARVLRVIDVWPGDNTVVSIGLETAKPAIETIAVSASRYEILRDIAASRFFFDQRTIQNMPDVGEDPMRVMQRLPGAAASGASAKTHFRGGEDGEIGIILNGLRLFDPFHMRDYQSVFSAIDSRAIEGIEVYTGGFPVRFGDRMSGLVLMESLEPPTSRHTEIGVSVFNTSLLTSGHQRDHHWLLSARRGNLDLVLDPSVGQPSYYDVFAEYGFDISPDATFSVNALFADDSVKLVLESDPLELEQVESQTQNAQLWLQLANRWTPDLSSKTVLSGVAFKNLRDGSLGDDKKIVASVYDRREVKRVALRQDWTLNRADTHLVQWGLEAAYASADYDYRNAAEYFELQALYANQPQSVSNAATVMAKGGSLSLYFSDRWKLSSTTIVEWGLRWDDQTYTGLTSDAQLSPRFNILRTLGPKTELRFSWGRYHQSQAINEMQIEDGITDFLPAQRADHYIASIRHLLADNYAVRFELFHKDLQKVRPRFENLFDPLGLIPEVQPDRVRLDPSSARSSGVELSVDRSSGPLTWWAAYTYSKASDRIDGVEQLRSWDQPHAFQGGVSWSNAKWDVALAASAHTGWPATDLMLVEDGVDADGEPRLIAVPGPRNVLRQGTFASLDFRVSRRWHLPRGSLMAFFEVSNLTNRRNECCFDFDLEENEVSGERELVNSLDYWMPILPAVGVLWEF